MRYIVLPIRHLNSTTDKASCTLNSKLETEVSEVRIGKGSGSVSDTEALSKGLFHAAKNKSHSVL